MKCDSVAKCTCTYDCPRHGKCCECIAHHNERGEFVGCQFSKDGEAKYDRSYANLVADRTGRRG